MDIGTLANIGTMLAVFFGLIFGALQVRQNAAKRRDAAIAEIMRAQLYRYFAVRREASPNAAEWFEWLVVQLDAHPLPWKTQGAHAALRSWKP